jgi:hypothetical protein
MAETGEEQVNVPSSQHDAEAGASFVSRSGRVIRREGVAYEVDPRRREAGQGPFRTASSRKMSMIGMKPLPPVACRPGSPSPGVAERLAAARGSFSAVEQAI